MQMQTLRNILLYCVVGLLVACNASPSQRDIQSQEARDRSEMMAALQKSTDSWNKADLKGHLAIYDESVTVMTKSGPRPTVAAIEAAFSKAYFIDGKPKQSLRMENASIRMLSSSS